MSPFRFNIGQRVFVSAEYIYNSPLFTAGVDSKTPGEVVALIADKQGMHALVRFPGCHFTLPEDVMFGVS